MIISTKGNEWAGPVAWERNKCYSRTKFTKKIKSRNMKGTYR